MSETGTEPFFILGCVRSGTTMLRDLLRSVPNLCCPEETHIYRWAEPFGTPGFAQRYATNAQLASHREIDGVSEKVNADVLAAARSRREYLDGYMQAFLATQGLASTTRWFDKTPQNVFCAPLLALDYPSSRFVHLHRDPRNVVASLQVGKVMKVDSVVGGANYWRESVGLALALGDAHPTRVLTVRYADLTGSPREHLDQICDFVDLQRLEDATIAQVRPERPSYVDVLDADDLAIVDEVCGELAGRLGYDLDTDLRSAG